MHRSIPENARLGAAAFVFFVGLFVGTALLANKARADWLSDTFAQMRNVIGIESRHLRDRDWQMTSELVARIPAGVSQGSVAATVAGKGHWTFANRDGQRFTAAAPAEMQRVASALYPEAGAAVGLTIYLSPRVIFQSTDRLKDLPATARLRVAWSGRSYPLLARRTADGKAAELVAAVRPDVLVPANKRALFGELVWQLERQMSALGMRLLSVTSDGPAALSSFAARQSSKARGTPVIEPIAPQHLRASLAGLAGQAALLTARLENDRLVFRNADSSEISLEYAPLRAAAARHDVGLVLLNARAPRQPGVRNWLWQKVDVDGLAAALQRETLADFLGSLAIAGAKVEVRGAIDDGRTKLDIRPVEGGLMPTSTTGIVDLIAEFASEVVGTVVPSAASLEMPSAARTRELQRRIVPGVHSLVQITFLLLIVVGLLALPVAVRWWQRVWPAENRVDYGTRSGFEAARVVRILTFLLVFLPLVSLPAVIWGGLGLLGRLMLAPMRMRRPAVD